MSSVPMPTGLSSSGATRNSASGSRGSSNADHFTLPDLCSPLAVFGGLSGNAPTVFGGNQGNGNYSIGLAADVYQKYRFDLKYIDYFGRLTANAAGTAVDTQNGFTSLLKDRGSLYLTFKTTF